jgi:SAM-dependent methyltransferase
MNRIAVVRRKIADRLYSWLYISYYRVVFGRHIPLANQIAKIIHAREMREQKGDAPGDIPLSGDLWERQYLSGQWKYMMDLDELARYSVMVGYMEHLKSRGNILDVGCGEGILFKKFLPYGYSSYFGIDISSTAIAVLNEYRDEKTFFAQADAESYLPEKTFDVIVFNEVLCYFHDPIKVVERYALALQQEGVLLVETHVASLRAMAILRRLKSMYTLIDETKTTHASSSNSWICSVFSNSHKEK